MATEKHFYSDFDRVYIEYYPRLVRFATAYLHDVKEAENVVQDIFLKLWENKRTEDADDYNASYLFTAAKYRCIDTLRQMRRKETVGVGEKKEIDLEIFSLLELDSDSITLDEIEAILTKALEQLPPRCREIFVKCKIDGRSHDEVAEELGITVNTIESQMTIALKRLRIALKDYLYLYILFII